MAIDKITTASITDANITTAKLAYNANQFRNIIINGDMSQAQRATSVTGIGNGNAGYHTCDRWKLHEGGATAAEFTQSQSTDVPTGQGFATSFKMDCTTADTSLAADEIMNIYQRFEGQNLQYLKKGTSSAESLTLSFWVKATKTGTYVTNLYDNDNNRAINKTYTISSSDTWEKKTITFAGDTSGVLGNDNASSLEVYFQLFAGSNYTSGSLQTSWGSYNATQWATGQVNVADSTSNNWLITGVQLEAGTTASDFEFLPVDVNLGRCQRYYYVHADGASSNKRVFNGGAYNGSLLDGTVFFPTTMRTNPSMDVVSGTNYYTAYGNGGNDAVNDFNIQESNINSAGVRNDNTFSGNQGDAYFVITTNSSAKLAFSAEL